MLVITFESHYASLCAKNKLKGSFEISPTPRIVSSTCASCLLDENKHDVEKHELEEYTRLDGVEGVYVIKGNSKEVVYER